MKKQIASIVLISLLAACASEKQKDTAAAAKQAAEAPKPAEGITAHAATGGDGQADANPLLSKRSVFYPFDIDTVQPSDKPMVMAHAQYLRDHPNSKVQVEGNADERGSNEYNLALGQRRAEGVAKMLVLGGADKSQIETVSYGEEKPKAAGHNEDAWAQNRRTDFDSVK